MSCDRRMLEQQKQNTCAVGAVCGLVKNLYFTIG